ncbi:uncharacterized protein [Oscarella lobularis]|uniref:uncharacterized protein n=1 Tax=Oscarella lobularis TaxID=121494 RepID=UPI0033134A73
MASLLTVVLCIGLAFVQINAQAVLIEPKAEVIEDRFFVVFQRNISVTERMKHMLTMDDLSKSLGAEVRFEVRREFTIGNSFRAYTAHMCQKMVQQVLLMPEVRYVTPDQIATIAQEQCVTQEEATWGLVRTSSRVLNIDGYYEYRDEDAGEGVEAYVIDTGIYTGHNEFQAGRASQEFDPVYNDPNRPDGNGHGTHVASTIVGQLYGLAKKATVIGVRVLNDNGSGSYEDVIGGVEWTAEVRREKSRTTVGNMSLGGPQNVALDEAIVAAAEAGVVMVVAAGNEATDACIRSPAASDGAITVGATDNTDTKASFSNQGKCVEIYCPGQGITGAWIGSPVAINTISGTSMASPHVAGIAVKYLTQNPTATPVQVEEWITEQQSTKDIVNGLNSDSFNRLCFMDCNPTSK